MHELTADCRLMPADDALPQVVAGLGGRSLALGTHDTLDGLERLWEEIAAEGAEASVFQSHRWLSIWSATAARHAGERPLIVTGRSADRRLQMVLPLGIKRRFGLNVAGFLGQSHANYGLGFLAPDLAATMTDADIVALFRAIARLTPIDAVHLDHQPAAWNGVRNPFVTSDAMVSANDSHVLPLEQDFSTLHARLFSSKTRSTMRRKERRLNELGGCHLGKAKESIERLHLIESFMAAKSRQLREAGISDLFSEPGLRQFYHALARQPEGITPQIDVIALAAAGDVGAVAVMADDGRRRYLLNTALTSQRMRDLSPGQILLTNDIAQACAAGTSAYDFGPGSAAYKSAWAPRRVPLMTTLLALTPAGLPLVTAMRAKDRLKRLIKRTPALWHVAQRLRRTLRGHNAAD